MESVCTHLLVNAWNKSSTRDPIWLYQDCKLCLLCWGITVMLLVKTLFFVCLCACPSRDAPLEAPSGSTQSKATPSTTVTGSTCNALRGVSS